MEHLLIEREDFATKKPLPESFSNEDYRDKVKPCIEFAQLFSLKPELGTDFYNEIVGISKTGETTGTLTDANYVALRPYLVPVLVYFTWANMIGGNQLNMTRTGVVQKSNPNSNPLSSNMIKQQVLDHNNKGHAYLDRLIEFIEDNEANYPTYEKTYTSESANRSIRFTPISRD